MNQEIIGETVAGESAKVRKQLEALISNMNKNSFDIGELLSQVRQGGHYKPVCDTFYEYIRTLDIKPRKAQYLMRIADVMAEVGVPRAKYEAVGTAKLRAITSLDPKGSWTNPDTKEEIPLSEYIAGMVANSKDMPLKEVKQHVRTLKGFVGENDLVWMNICLKRSALENTVEPAFELTRKQLGDKGKDAEGIATEYSDGTCLEMICADVLASGLTVDSSN